MKFFGNAVSRYALHGWKRSFALLLANLTWYMDYMTNSNITSATSSLNRRKDLAVSIIIAFLLSIRHFFLLWSIS